MEIGKHGYFVISLDLELHWGRFDKVPIDNDRTLELRNTVKLIPRMLELFKLNQIHATWAIVGMLLNEDEIEWKTNIPAVLPDYKNNHISPYHFFNNHYTKSDYTALNFFCPTLIHLIRTTNYQELASHTYSHYYCLEEGQDENSFKFDLQAMENISYKHAIQISSIVFPRNQLNLNYLSKLGKFSYKYLRSNPTSWYWNNRNFRILSRICRIVDTFNILSYSKCIKLNEIKIKEGIVFMPSSRFLRSWNPTLKILNKLKLKRILLEMTYAAKNNLYYHLWWHPENFGSYPEENYKELEIIITHYKELNAKYNFTSVTMSEMGEILK